ncbi:hypothetical protein [Flavilitoribacter nigricans]|uniref:Uncharacterized protein n=1 Tax=Flavilitoribacter nigricans (strain ATCC 23147 / DSM 23189 / NBRC 102662 / NCIMB 1420 / SS-2) TaxID=1122177 RepID=A0A2D0N575_FLAN2|nr:hypothetical protein [Flavilitoribacter nigricans]PHN03692.1 hypothetical protein CRP01_25935 [Flavilitoribacter nigricans DSM 23189 = NBRC 102662]
MKKILKWLGIGLLVLIVGLFIAGWIISEPLPEGEAGPEAEALAEKVLSAINQPAWDSTHYVRWNFADRHQYTWDRDRKLVQVEWPENRVILPTENHLQGMAWENGTQLDDKKATKKLNKAWEYFCNDSFWFIAPEKVFDPGTSRKTVALEDGSKGLLITYSSGGTTPGDSYLWILDKDGLPVKWKMWVSLLPIGGLEATWADWEKLPTGAKVATFHEIGSYQLRISEIQAGKHWKDIGESEDPFAPLF